MKQSEDRVKQAVISSEDRMEQKVKNIVRAEVASHPRVPTAQFAWSSSRHPRRLCSAWRQGCVFISDLPHWLNLNTIILFAIVWELLVFKF